MTNSVADTMATTTDNTKIRAQGAHLRKSIIHRILFTPHPQHSLETTQTQQKQDTLSFVQINLHGGSRATDTLASYVAANSIQVALLQDYHQNKKTGNITGFKPEIWNITNAQQNRSAIITRLGTKPISILQKNSPRQ